MRNGSVQYTALSSRDKIIPPVRKICRRLGVKKLSEISSDKILYETLVEIVQNDSNLSSSSSTTSSLPLVSKLRLSDVNLIDIIQVTVERLMESEKFRNRGFNNLDNHIFYDPVCCKLSSASDNTLTASTALPNIAFVTAINLFWETTSTLFKSICSNSCSYCECFDLFLDLIVIILSVGKVDPISMYSFLAPLDLITQRMMYELSDKVVESSIYSTQLLPYEISYRDYYCQFIAIINYVSKPVEEYISRYVIYAIFINFINLHYAYLISFMTNNVAQYFFKKSLTLSRQLLELLCWCSPYHQMLPPIGTMPKSVNVNDSLIKLLSDEYNITIDNQISATWMSVSEHMRVTLGSLLSISINDRVSASLLNGTGITSLGIFGMTLHSHMQSNLLSQCNSNIIEFSLSLNEHEMHCLTQSNNNNCRRDQGVSSRHFKTLLKETRSISESLMADLMSAMSSMNKSTKGVAESGEKLIPRDDLKLFAKRNADMSLLCSATDKLKVVEAAVSISTSVGTTVNKEVAISLINKISNGLTSFGYSSQNYIPPSSLDSDKTMAVNLPFSVHVKDVEGFGAYGITSKLPLGCSITYLDLSYDKVCMSLRQLTNEASTSCDTMKVFISIVLVFVKQHKLIDLTDGNLSVSAILHMIVHFFLKKKLIQIDRSISTHISYKWNNDCEVDGGSMESCDPITLLHKFCYYYSYEFNIFDDVVSITSEKSVHKSLKSQYRSCVMWRLYIEDISNSAVDMGSSLTRPGQIQLFKAFRRCVFATLRILESIKLRDPGANLLIPHLFDKRMLDLAMVGGYKGANVTNVPVLNQLLYRQHKNNTIVHHNHVPVDENPRQKADVETKVENEVTTSRVIVAASSVFTNMVASGMTVKNSKDSFNIDNTSASISGVVRSKPFIPKLAIAETPPVSDNFGKYTHDFPFPSNVVGFEPGSGHTDRSISSTSSRSDMDLSSARSLHEFNTIIDHLTSTAAMLSDNISGRNSARGVDATVYISTEVSNAVESVSLSVTEPDTKKSPRLVHWKSYKK